MDDDEAIDRFCEVIPCGRSAATTFSAIWASVEPPRPSSGHAWYLLQLFVRDDQGFVCDIDAGGNNVYFFDENWPVRPRAEGLDIDAAHWTRRAQPAEA